MAADWSKLPLDPLGAVAMKFDVFDDFIRFSAVCQGWNRATSLVEHQWKAPLPSLLLAENTIENPDGLRKIFDLNNNQIYQLKLPETFGTRCWGSPYGWVAMADNNRNIQLFNPITKAQIHFPSLRSLTHYDDDDDVDNDDCEFKYWLVRDYLFKLIVLKVSRNDKHEFVIMVIYKNHRHVDFARQGDQSWTPVSTKEKMDTMGRLLIRIIDVVAKNDDIFALYDDGSIVHWHTGEFCSGKLLIPTDYSPPATLGIVLRGVMVQFTKYLLESHGDLILVVRQKEEFHDEHKTIEHYETKFIDVFKLTKHNGWEKIEDLGNVALFVGGNYSMSISLGVGQCLQHSGIYFTDDEFEYWHWPKELGGHDTGFYDVKLNKSQFYEHDDMRSVFCPSTWSIYEF